MRPWMKMLAIGGVMGVALGVSLAGEKPTVRRSAPPAVNSQPGRLEFISRGGAASEQSNAPVDPTTDHVAEELAAGSYVADNKMYLPAPPWYRPGVQQAWETLTTVQPDE